VRGGKNKLQCFSLAIFIKASFIFVGKAKSLPAEWSTLRQSTRVGPGLAHRYWASLKKIISAIGSPSCPTIWVDPMPEPKILDYSNDTFQGPNILSSLLRQMKIKTTCIKSTPASFNIKLFAFLIN
jgi:hypothetical protein